MRVYMCVCVCVCQYPCAPALCAHALRVFCTGAASASAPPSCSRPRYRLPALPGSLHAPAAALANSAARSRKRTSSARVPRPGPPSPPSLPPSLPLINILPVLAGPRCIPDALLRAEGGNEIKAAMDSSLITHVRSALGRWAPLAILLLELALRSPAPSCFMFRFLSQGRKGRGCFGSTGRSGVFN